MTIHGSKGLQAPVVVVSGLFSAGKADASMSVQDNILVTPQVLAGRIQPWRANDRPQDGLWAFAAEMNKAQDKARVAKKILRCADSSEGSSHPHRLTRKRLNVRRGNGDPFGSHRPRSAHHGADVHRRAASSHLVRGWRRSLGNPAGAARNNLTAVQTSTISDAAQPCSVTQRCPTGGRRLSRTASLPPFAML